MLVSLYVSVFVNIGARQFGKRQPLFSQSSVPSLIYTSSFSSRHSRDWQPVSVHNGTKQFWSVSGHLEPLLDNQVKI
jgi:hypothetical protein